jgi:hypothetical protein
MSSRTSNITNYHFKVIKKDKNHIEVKYYLTADDVAKDFNCTKPTVFSKIKGIGNSRKFDGYDIESSIYPVQMVNKLLTL